MTATSSASSAWRLPLLTTAFGLTAASAGLLGAASLIGMFFGGLIFGAVTDRARQAEGLHRRPGLLRRAVRAAVLRQRTVAADRAAHPDGRRGRRGPRYRGHHRLGVRTAEVPRSPAGRPGHDVLGGCGRGLHRRLLHAAARARRVAMDAGEQRDTGSAHPHDAPRHTGIPSLAAEPGADRRGRSGAQADARSERVTGRHRRTRRRTHAVPDDFPPRIPPHGHCSSPCSGRASWCRSTRSPPTNPPS